MNKIKKKNPMIFKGVRCPMKKEAFFPLLSSN